MAQAQAVLPEKGLKAQAHASARALGHFCSTHTVGLFMKVFDNISEVNTEGERTDRTDAEDSELPLTSRNIRSNG
jgi:hypothetical protein